MPSNLNNFINQILQIPQNANDKKKRVGKSALNSTAEKSMLAMSEHVKKQYNTKLTWTKPGTFAGFKKISATPNKLSVTVFLPKMKGKEHFVQDMEKGDKRKATENQTILIPSKFFYLTFPHLMKKNRATKKKMRLLLKNKKKYRIFRGKLSNGRPTIFQAGWNEADQKFRPRKKVKGAKYSRRKGGLKPKIHKRRILNNEVRPLAFVENEVQELPTLDMKKTISVTFGRIFTREYNRLMRN